MTTLIFTSEDADRILGIGDEFLCQWAEAALRNDKRDPDYEERNEEWSAIRPLFAAAPEMLAALEAQEMADADPQASRRKGCFERATQLRRAAITKATGGRQ
jgi:hypothetical protein